MYEHIVSHSITCLGDEIRSCRSNDKVIYRRDRYVRYIIDLKFPLSNVWKSCIYCL